MNKPQPTQSYLFVGGVSDGKWTALPNPKPVVRVPVYDENSPGAEFEYVEYRRIDLWPNVAVYTPVGEESKLIERLITEYRDRNKPRVPEGEVDRLGIVVHESFRNLSDRCPFRLGGDCTEPKHARDFKTCRIMVCPILEDLAGY